MQLCRGRRSPNCAGGYFSRHRGHPQTLVWICRGLLRALRAMVGHHLTTPSLLWDAGKEPDRVPAPAACTFYGLRYVQFAENGAKGAHGELIVQLGWDGDQLVIGVPRLIEQVARRVLDT